MPPNKALRAFKRSGYNMADPLVPINDLAISSTWEFAALVDQLKHKGLLAKDRMLHSMREVRLSTRDAIRRGWCCCISGGFRWNDACTHGFQFNSHSRIQD